MVLPLGKELKKQKNVAMCLGGGQITKCYDLETSAPINLSLRLRKLA